MAKYRCINWQSTTCWFATTLWGENDCIKTRFFLCGGNRTQAAQCNKVTRYPLHQSHPHYCIEIHCMWWDNKQLYGSFKMLDGCCSQTEDWWRELDLRLHCDIPALYHSLYAIISQNIKQLSCTIILHKQDLGLEFSLFQK